MNIYSVELGCWQVDMMSQGDSVYDFVDKRDHAAWKSKLIRAGRSTNQAYSYDTVDRYRATTVDNSSFYCRMYRARNCRRLPPACTEYKVGFSSFVTLLTSHTNVIGIRKVISLWFCRPLSVCPHDKNQNGWN